MSMPKQTPTIEATEPSTTIVEVSATIEEVRVLSIPTGEGTSKAANAICMELVVVILQEFPPDVPEATVPPSHKNVP